VPDISRLVIEVDSRGVVNAEGNMDAFEAMLRKTGKSTDELAKKFGVFQLIINKLPGPLKSLASGLLGIVSPAQAVVGALIELGESAVKYVKESIDAFAKFEMIKTNLEVVSSSAEEASRTFNELQRFSSKTPFNLEQLSQAGIMLRQAGTSASEMIPLLEALGNVSSGNADVFNRMAMNLAQVANVGKATSMDMRQFMMAGIPINQLLKDIGKEGSTSFEDIRDAILAASREGGRFEGAMEKGSQTIAGLRTQVEGLKEQYKALSAEYYNMIGIARWWNESQRDYYSIMTEVMSTEIELQKIRDKKNNGTAAISDLYREAELIVEMAEKTSDINTGNNTALKAAAQFYRSQSSAMQEILNRYQPWIDAQNELNRQQEEHNRLLDESASGYSNLQSKIEEMYAKTTEGQIKAKENEIAWWRAELDRQRYVDEYTYQGMNAPAIITGKKLVGITDEDRNSIDTIIKMLEDDLDKLVNGSSKTTKEFEKWVELLSQVTGLTKENVESMGGLATVEKYAAEVEKIRERLLAKTPDGGFIYELLGLNRSDLFEDAASKISDLVMIMTESGIWDFNNDSYVIAIESLNKFNQEAKDTRGQEYLAKIYEEIADSQLSAYELAVKRAIEEGRISEEVARQSEELRQQERERALLAEITEQIEDSQLSSFDLAVKRLATEKNISKEAAEQYIKMQDAFNFDKYISGLNEELSLLRMTSSEAERQRLISEYRVTNEEKIAAALRDQNALRNEQNKLNTLSSITGIPLEELKGTSLNFIGQDIGRRSKNEALTLDYLKEIGIINTDAYVSGLESIANNLSDMIKAFNNVDNIRSIIEVEPRYIDYEDEYGMMSRIPDPTDYFGLFLEGLKKLLDNALTDAMSAREDNYLNRLAQELEDANLDTYSLAIKRLAIEQQISEAAAKRGIDQQDQLRFINYITGLQQQRSLIGASLEDRVSNQLTGRGIIKPNDDQIYKTIQENNLRYIATLTEQLNSVGKSTLELTIKRLMLEQSITEETAKQAIKLQNQIDYITNGYDYMGELTIAINDALRSIRSGEGGYGDYANAKFGQAGMSMIQGSDAGNFVEGFQAGGPWVAVINTLVGALSNVLGGMEGFSQILNPITEMLGAFKDIIKAAIVPGLIISKLLVLLAQGINWLLNIITFGLIDEMSKLYDTLIDTNDERGKEAERLRALNEQYGKLLVALKEQEEYYLQQRRSLNSESAIENFQTRSVNDMILSPHGAFSTDPKDYIIATKNPHELMGGGSNVIVQINNNSDANITQTESVSPDGSRLIEVTIEKIMQKKFADGSMDSSIDAMNQRRTGRKAQG
jgi:archaellum component FlaC